jgi:hypothetical protein
MPRGAPVACSRRRRHAPAWLRSKASRKRACSKNDRSRGPARSSGFTLSMRRAPSAPSPSSAPANDAISAKDIGPFA